MRVEILDANRDVTITGTEVVGAAVVVERELELFCLAGEPEKVVRRLNLAVADDVHVATKLQPECLVEGAAAGWIGDAVHRVEVHTCIVGKDRVPRSGTRSSRRAERDPRVWP